MGDETKQAQPHDQGMKLARTGDDRTSFNTYVFPADHYVLVDYPLAPEVTLTFVETHALVGVGKPKMVDTPTKLMTEKANPIKEYGLVGYLLFLASYESSSYSLVVKQGDADTVLFAGASGSDLLNGAPVGEPPRWHRYPRSADLTPPDVSFDGALGRVLNNPTTPFAKIIAAEPQGPE